MPSMGHTDTPTDGNKRKAREQVQQQPARLLQVHWEKKELFLYILNK